MFCGIGTDRSPLRQQYHNGEKVSQRSGYILLRLSSTTGFPGWTRLMNSVNFCCYG